MVADKIFLEGEHTMLRVTTVLLLLLLVVFSARATVWSSVKDEHFVVLYSENEGRAKDILKMSEDFFAEVTSDIGYLPTRKITIWFFESKRDFRRAFNAPIEDWAAGYAYPLSARIVIHNPTNAANRKISLEHLVKHEITHVVFGLYLGQNLQNVPRWFNEGVAMYEADQWNQSENWTMLTASLSHSLIPLYQLADVFPRDESSARVAYAESCSIVMFMVKEYGRESLKECIRALAEGNGIDESMAIATGIDTGWLEKKWLEEIRSRYKWITFITSWVFLWGFITMLVLIAYWRRRIRNRHILQQWEEEEEWELFNDDGY